MKTVYQIALAVIIAILGYFLYESIMEPIRFEKEKNRRYNATIERLKSIRTAQDAYRSRFGKYTGSFDTLIKRHNLSSALRIPPRPNAARM